MYLHRNVLCEHSCKCTQCSHAQIFFAVNCPQWKSLSGQPGLDYGLVVLRNHAQDYLLCWSKASTVSLRQEALSPVWCTPAVLDNKGPPTIRNKKLLSYKVDCIIIRDQVHSYQHCFTFQVNSTQNCKWMSFRYLPLSWRLFSLPAFLLMPKKARIYTGGAPR